MKYSIIVPVHNAESTITRCVESVVSQNVDLQVILIENGSSDRSANECEILSQNIIVLSIIKVNYLGYRMQEI